MYKIISILLFILLSNVCQAQVPNFFADGSRWVYYTRESSEPGQQTVHASEEQIIIHGDTVIGGLEYFKLYTTHHNMLEVFLSWPPHTEIIHSYDSIGPTFLRYDTIQKRVFYLPSIDSTERLIYDFDLEVGDTTPMQSTTFSTTVVHSIDTVSIFGVSLKRFNVTEANSSFAEFSNYILEGIGGSNGLISFQPLWGFLGGGIYWTEMRCFQYQDSIYAPYDGECPFIDFISTVEQVSETHTLTISPNPTQGLFTVNIGDELLNATFTIINNLGQRLQSFTLTELHSTGHLHSPGLYFWRIEKDGRLIRTGKLICQ